MAEPQPVDPATKPKVSVSKSHLVIETRQGNTSRISKTRIPDTWPELRAALEEAILIHGPADPVAELAGEEAPTPTGRS